MVRGDPPSQLTALRPFASWNWFAFKDQTETRVEKAENQPCWIWWGEWRWCRLLLCTTTKYLNQAMLLNWKDMNHCIPQCLMGIQVKSWNKFLLLCHPFRVTKNKRLAYLLIAHLLIMSDNWMQSWRHRNRTYHMYQLKVCRHCGHLFTNTVTS